MAECRNATSSCGPLSPINAGEVMRAIRTALLRSSHEHLDDEVAAARARKPIAASTRELTAHVVMAALVFAGTAVLAALDPASTPSLTVIIAMIALQAIAGTVQFEVGTGYTIPTLPVLVVMLFQLPPAWVPVCVAAGFAVSLAITVVRGDRHPARVLLAPGHAVNAIAPAAVMLWLAPSEPSWADPTAIAVAFAAYVGFDALTSFVADVVAYGARVRELLGPASWVYLVDLLLAPVGFAAAIAADGSATAAGAFLLPLFALLAIFAGERRERIDQALQLSKAYRGTAMLLGDMVEADDAYTGSHSRHVVELAVEVGHRMRLSAAQLRNLEFAALLHDVGKVAVPNEILNKPGKLDPLEWEIMKRHTINGQQMLEGVGGVLADVGGIVRASHEDFRGTGYPDGLEGEAIPIESRICSVCDAFSAMTTDRPYRHAMSPQVATDELRRCAGTQFDPRVVEILVDILEEGAVELVVAGASERLASDLAGGGQAAAAHRRAVTR